MLTALKLTEAAIALLWFARISRIGWPILALCSTAFAPVLWVYYTMR